MMDVEVALAEIGGKFDIVMQNIATIKEKQEEMALDIAEIKKAVYHPDQGLYARIRELEQWKDGASRLIWILMTSVVTLGVATIYRIIFS